MVVAAPDPARTRACGEYICDFQTGAQPPRRQAPLMTGLPAASPVRTAGAGLHPGLAPDPVQIPAGKGTPHIPSRDPAVTGDGWPATRPAPLDRHPGHAAGYALPANHTVRCCPSRHTGGTGKGRRRITGTYDHPGRWSQMPCTRIGWLASGMCFPIDAPVRRFSGADPAVSKGWKQATSGTTKRFPCRQPAEHAGAGHRPGVEGYPRTAICPIRMTPPPPS